MCNVCQQEFENQFELEIHLENHYIQSEIDYYRFVFPNRTKETNNDEK